MDGKEFVSSPKCFVIGAGDFELDNLPDYREGFDTLIAVDGGLSHCGRLSLEPDMIVGDFDSLEETLLEAVCEIERRCPEKVLRLKPEKDDTDMLVALKWGLARGCSVFEIYGGMGGRLDHTLANIQCLLYLKNQGAEGYLMGNKDCILTLTGESKCFQPSMEGYLSLFSLEKESIVSIANMKYPLSSYAVTNDYPIGISNEFLPGKSGCVTVHAGAVAVLLHWTS